MFKIGDYLTPATYKEGAIWATANRAQINPNTWRIEPLPEPTKEQQSTNRETAYQQYVDPITCHISRLMDEEQTEDITAEITALKSERAAKVAEIKAQYPYPEVTSE